MDMELIRIYVIIDRLKYCQEKYVMLLVWSFGNMPQMKHRRASSSKKGMSRKRQQDLETFYLQILTQYMNESTKRDNSSLRQPSALKIVNSVTTYGAYENPI
jgi:hypothetical protein